MGWQRSSSRYTRLSWLSIWLKPFHMTPLKPSVLTHRSSSLAAASGSWAARLAIPPKRVGWSAIFSAIASLTALAISSALRASVTPWIAGHISESIEKSMPAASMLSIRASLKSIIRS